MKKILIGMSLVGLSAVSLAADEVGRYQVVALPKTDTVSYQSVIVLDTKEGHIWEWSAQPSYGSSAGGYYLRYQGKVRPGKTMGEIIEQKRF